MSTLLPFPQINGVNDQQFSKDGTALTREQREARAERKGLCSRCGIKTHKFSFGRRNTITNEHVYDGHCIKCDPDMVPLKIVVEWEELNPDQIPLAKRTQLHNYRGAHRQQRPAMAAAAAPTDNGPDLRRNNTPDSIRASNHSAHAPSSEHLRMSTNSSAAASSDRCPTCGIHTHEVKTIKSKRSSLLGKKHKETQFVPLTITDAVLAGRCLLCHPLPVKKNSTNSDKKPAAVKQQRPTSPEDGVAIIGVDVPPIAPANADSGAFIGVAVPPIVPKNSTNSRKPTNAAPEESLAREADEQQVEVSLGSGPKEQQSMKRAASRDPDADIKMISNRSEYAGSSDVELARQESGSLSGQELVRDATSDSTPQRSRKAFEETVGVAFGAAVSPSEQQPSNNNTNENMEEDEIDVDVSLVGETDVDYQLQDDVDIEVNVDVDAAQQQSPVAGLPQSVQIGAPPAAAAAAVRVEADKDGQPYDNNNELAIATAVLVVPSPPGQDPPTTATDAVVPVPTNISLDADSGQMAEDHEQGRANWPAPWPLNRSTHEEVDGGSSSDDSNVQEHVPLDADFDGDNSGVSSINFGAAEDMLIAQQASASSFRDRSMTEKSFTDRDISMADSSLQRSAKKMVDCSSKTYPEDSVGSYKMDAMSNSARQSTRNSTKAISSSNSLMAEMMGTGDLSNWLQDFAAECNESDSFRAQAAERGGIVAVISAMKVNKTDVAIQKQGCLALHSLAKDHGTTIAKQGGVQSLLSAIKHHGQDDPQLHEYACGALVFVATNDSYKAVIARKGGVAAILTATQRHINYLPVQHQACAALLRLSSQINVVDVLASSKHQGIKTVVESMKRHRDDILLQQYGCGILKNIAQKETARQAISGNGGAGALVSAIRRHHNSGNLLQQACWALCEISASQNIAKDGAIGAVIAAMESHKENAKIQQHGCGVLKNLSVTRQNIHSIAKLNGIETILDAMQNHVGNAALQRCACGALKHLSLSNTNERAIARKGGIKVVVQAMKAHKIDGTVQREACGALRNLSINESNKGMIGEHGGVVTLLVAMKLNRNDESLQQKACGALLNLSSNADLRRTIASYGGVIAVIAIMKHLAGDAKVQQYACGTIKNLAVSSELKKTVAANEGIPSVLAAMKRHGGDVKVQSCGCGALKNLSGDADNKQEITKHKGVIAIISAMKGHPNDASLQQEACATLLALSTIKENTVSVGKHGGIHAILAAMKRHSKTSAVQSSACGALWNLSTVGANMSIIYKNAGIDSIVTAMKMHVTVSTVVHKACLALSSMAVNDASRTAMQKVGGIAAAIEGMRAHVRDAHVQKYGCKFLATMLQSEDSKDEVAKGASAVRVALQYHSDNADLKRYAHKVIAAVSFTDASGNGAVVPPPITSIEC